MNKYLATQAQHAVYLWNVQKLHKWFVWGMNSNCNVFVNSNFSWKLFIVKFTKNAPKIIPTYTLSLVSTMYCTQYLMIKDLTQFKVIIFIFYYHYYYYCCCCWYRYNRQYTLNTCYVPGTWLNTSCGILHSFNAHSNYTQKVPFLSHFYKSRGWGYTCLRPHPSSMVELDCGLGPCPNHESTLLSYDR